MIFIFQFSICTYRRTLLTELHHHIMSGNHFTSCPNLRTMWSIIIFINGYNQQLSDFTGCGALFSLVCLLEPHLTHNLSVFILFWGFIYLTFFHLAGICVMLPAACNQKNDLMMKYVVEVIINNSATSDSICFVAFIFLFMFFFLSFCWRSRKRIIFVHICETNRQESKSKRCVLNIEENVLRGSHHV